MNRAATVPGIEEYPRRTGGAPLISVVTTVRNGEKTLGRTIESVRAQQIADLEYVITDANSTDGTHAIIAANADIITHWQSEKDRGISDGFNKGIALSRGKYVTLLNADDWLSPGQLVQGIRTLEETGADFVFGDLLYHDVDGKPLFRIRGEADYAKRIANIMPGLNHPTVIMRRTAYEKNGLFDLHLKLAMDYELLLRLHRAGCRGVYEPQMLGHMSLEGASDAASRRALAEVRDIAIRHGGFLVREWLRYLFRVLKGECRQLLAKMLPTPLLHRLRQAFNQNYAQHPP